MSGGVALEAVAGDRSAKGACDPADGPGGANGGLFRHRTDSANRSGRDTITDFTVTEDRIDLSGLVLGEITFLGTGGFTASGAAELRVASVPGGHSRLRINLDGDGTADMRVDLAGVAMLTEGDFVL